MTPRSSLKLVCLLFLLSAAAQLPGQVIVAKWTFEQSQPTTGGPISPEIGAGTASTLYGSSFSSPVGNGSDHSWSSAGHVGGFNADGFVFAVNTVGYSGIAVSFDLARTGAGPGSFSLAVGYDNSTYTTTGFPSISDNTWTDDSYQSAFTFNYASGFFFNDSMLADKPVVYFKVNAGIPNGSSLQIDNFTVTAIPEPSTYAALAGLGALGLAAWRRRRKLATQA